ncbi:protein kinase [Massilia sp. PAMC28688]|uniref:protein kinase domain-containing protein n=1 Tax=Massilia sp. PAMC28688 TaxID=2861283 RepID=UPI001C62A15A|nr:protein kinase [Massilia sp. PAMC28688]QYF93356.1 protein kinase [Massilia sp. PAMC28688]
MQARDVITLKAGSYRLDEVLARSAYGVVWRAHTGNGEEVAVKFINCALMEQAPAPLRERWVDSAAREIAFLRSLQPWDERHIVRLLDSGNHAGLPVMALELMATDLARQPAANASAADLGRILLWMGSVNQALAKVHQYGWLYLDLKPANVLLTTDQQARLADFGTSRLRSAGAPLSYSGTASWQAPEQFFPAPDGSYATVAGTDYFALGALFYYLVTGGGQLRFCQDCGQAHRELQQGASAAILARNAGRLPATLQGDEAARFAAAVDRMGGAGGSTAPAVSRPALRLLQALLNASPSARPRHALDISRMLADIRAAMCWTPPLPPAGHRAAAWSLA